MIYGQTKNINSYNPLRIAFHEWIDIWRRASSWKQRLVSIFGSPARNAVEQTKVTGTGA